MSDPQQICGPVDDLQERLEKRRRQAEEEAEREEAFLASAEGQAKLEAERQGEAMKRLHHRRTLLEAAAEQLGIPKRYWDATLEDITPEQFPGIDCTAPQATVQRVRRYLEVDFPKGRALVLSGPPGVGKTYCAAAAILAVFERQHGSSLDKASRATGMTPQPRSYLRQFWGVTTLRTTLMDLAKRTSVFEAILNTPFLVLDDIGVEYSKEGDYFESMLDALLVEREGNMRPILMTTNLTPDKLEMRLGARAMDRLRGDWGAVSKIVGPSVRHKGYPGA